VKIFGWSGDAGACEHFRLTLPLRELARQGHATAVNEQMPQAVQDGSQDVVVAQRTSNPAPVGLFLRMCRAGESLMVYELDDDFFSLTEDNPAYPVYDEDRQRRIRQCLEAAHLVTVSTEPLADVCRQFNDQVVVLGNYLPAIVQPRPAGYSSDTVTVGWSGGTSHNRDFGECAKPLRGFLQRHGDIVDFHCLGVDFTGRVASHRARTRHTGWNPSPSAYLDAVDFDIGLAPLRDTTFNHSKSPLRCLELAALGIPVIASNVTPYREFVRHEVTGLLVDNHREWAGALEHLTANPTVRAVMGAQARAAVSGMTVEANAHRWAQTYQDAIDRRSHAGLPRSLAGAR
jgi:glycosyltransferase involved in cell wall biosynthesis